jgi:predicted  nucleic acid-binding Zn-ribbon protein
MQAKVEELEKEVRHLETSVASSEEVEKELKQALYNVAGNYMQTISNLQAEVDRLKEELAYAYKGATMKGRR